jgi:RHS repeat-associated protein
VAENFLPDPGREKVISPQPLRMQGQYVEVETGLCYNTFRYYDPDIGRFISEDPIGLLGGTNLYGFAPNTDGWIDPWGWNPCRKSIRVAERTKKGVRRGRFLTEKQAQNRLRQGKDVFVYSSKKGAKRLAKKVSPTKKPMAHSAHQDKTGSTEGRLPHVHPNAHEGYGKYDKGGDGHVFYPKD